MASTYEQLLAQQRAEVSQGLFAATRRLKYSAERLAGERQRRLRDLLAVAAERPFYRERLAAAGVDPATATEADLPRIKPLTKSEMMARFDDIVDPELTLDQIEAHIDELNGDAYMAGQYRAIATGGSSGVRGVFVYGWRDWVEFMLLQMRWSVRRSAPAGAIGSTFARDGNHVSGALHAFFADETVSICHVPATMPIAEIVAALNGARPAKLQGYPTSIQLLANEATAGRLRIQPIAINTCGEQLTDDTRQAAKEAWDIQIDDIWGCTEGVYAYSCDAEHAMHLPDDLVIVEPVDANGDPVPPGQQATKIYLTNLYNRTQPLIRYELTDGMTLLDDPCSCGCAHRRIAEVSGHLDEVFVYGDGTVVQPIGLYTVLEHAPEITEFQVVQTAAGADVKIRADAQFDTELLRTAVSAMMAEAGLTDPHISVVLVDRLDRLRSGKLRRFVPITSAASMAD